MIKMCGAAQTSMSETTMPLPLLAAPGHLLGHHKRRSLAAHQRHLGSPCMNEFSAGRRAASSRR